MIIRNKFNGYVNGNNRLYPGGGGSPTQTTSYQTNIPEYAEPYVTTMLGATEKQVYKYGPSGEITGFQPFKSFSEYDKARGGTGETVSGFTPLQRQAMQGIGGYQLPGQGMYASQMAGGAGLGSMMAGRNYMNMATNPYATQAFMSPYMEGAVAPELREAARQSAILGQQNQAQAVQQGAFGDSRSAIVEAERQRNLNQQIEDISTKGLQSAYDNALKQRYQEAGLGLQAQEAGERSRQFGAQQGMQGAQLGAQFGLEAQKAGELSRQFGAQQGLTSAQQAAQFGLTAQQANQQAALEAARQAEASKQFGAKYGLEGLGQQLQAAQTLGSLGTQQQQAGLAGLQAQLSAGEKQQQLAQSPLDFAYQQFQESMKYPYQQTSYMQSLLQGLPLQARPYDSGQSGLAAALQSGLAGLALYNMFNKP